ncbi:serine/threonine-protein phosphatase 7 long form homolog [Neltuma alba]|uniref:serine/threonine-protein phosphatase 7 long form homolog n=1 Tax=Neltuma alba TaxID=207710 RepID=UPI0010A2D5FF|nr:serine/threonine-protein phosphatase 7 long form homolog [Prosopis alba]
MAQYPEEVINPGPEDNSLLYLQTQHISQQVWNENVSRILHTRRVMHANRMIEPPNQILEYLRLAGFYGVARVGQFDYDRSLVSALIERWRPETHTFHTTRGECTITLEDVAIQLGLPCVGMPVIGKTDFNWQDVCEWLLGVRPPADRILGQRLLMNWLEEHFNHLPDDADDVQVQQFTRAYILRWDWRVLIIITFMGMGSFSYASTTQQPVSPDPQSNIYPLLPPLVSGQNPRPSVTSLRQYRSLLDRMTDDDIIWQPYESSEVRQLIPEYCLATPEIWLASVPLICFHIIEWHHPDRVLRQFGRQQPIPVMPVHLGNYHTIQLRGRISTNWTEEYSNFIEAWNRWPHAVVDAPLALGELDRTSEYMQWYWRHTRRWIQRVSGDTGYVADIAEQLYRLTINSRSTCSDCIDYRERVARDQRNILLAVREQRFNMNSQPAPPPVELPRPQIPRDRPSKRRGGYLSTQPPIFYDKTLALWFRYLQNYLIGPLLRRSTRQEIEFISCLQD